MRKTIKVEKYPFPTGWEPAATYMIEGGDRKEVSAPLMAKVMEKILGPLPSFGLYHFLGYCLSQVPYLCLQ